MFCFWGGVGEGELLFSLFFFSSVEEERGEENREENRDLPKHLGKDVRRRSIQMFRPLSSNNRSFSREEIEGFDHSNHGCGWVGGWEEDLVLFL